MDLDPKRRYVNLDPTTHVSNNVATDQIFLQSKIDGSSNVVTEIITKFPIPLESSYYIDLESRVEFC